MSLKSTIGHVTKRYGAKYTVRKVVTTTPTNSWTAATTGPTYTTVIAKERGYKPNEIRGGIQENDSLVVVDATSAASAPAIGERIALGEHVADVGADWRQIVNVYSARENGEVRTYRLQVRR